MPALRRRLTLPLSGLLAVLMLVSSCGLLGGNDRSSSAGQSQDGPTEIKISVLPTTDLAPFYLALKNGYFKDAKLTIDGKKDVIVAKSSEDSTDKLNSGEGDTPHTARPGARSTPPPQPTPRCFSIRPRGMRAPGGA